MHTSHVHNDTHHDKHFILTRKLFHDNFLPLYLIALLSFSLSVSQNKKIVFMVSKIKLDISIINKAFARPKKIKFFVY